MFQLAEGTIFSNRYRIVRLIGRGGMGAVYEVVHLETERRRALKVMSVHMLESEEMRSRFRQEAKVAAHIDSEHIVDVFDAGVDETTGMPFLVMELLRGEEVGKKLKARGRFPFDDVVLYLYQAALALEKTHKVNIVHRDLKPDNLFITLRENGQPHMKLLDFGIAKFISPGVSNGNATTNIGTPLYMAPEQFEVGKTVSPQTDIYALGMIAYTLLVGVSYWNTELSNAANIFAFAHIAGNGPSEPASVRALRRGVVLPPGFDAWFATATASQPIDRFPAALEAIRALAVVLNVALPNAELGTSAPQSLAHGSNQNIAPISSSPLAQANSEKIGLDGLSGQIEATRTVLISTNAKKDKSRAVTQFALAIGIALGLAGMALVVISLTNQAPLKEKSLNSVATDTSGVYVVPALSTVVPTVIPTLSFVAPAASSIDVSSALGSAVPAPTKGGVPALGSALTRGGFSPKTMPSSSSPPKNDLIKRF